MIHVYLKEKVRDIFEIVVRHNNSNGCSILSLKVSGSMILEHIYLMTSCSINKVCSYVC